MVFVDMANLTMTGNVSNNDGGVKVYWNGQLQSQSPDIVDIRPMDPPPGNVVVGRLNVDEDDKYSSVVVDEFAIWDQVLTEEQINILSDYYLPKRDPNIGQNGCGCG